MLQNEWKPNILDRLYQIMFKIIILSQIGADRYQKNHFRNTTFVPPLESCAVELKESKSNEISVLRHSFIGADERKLSMMEVNYRRTRPK